MADESGVSSAVRDVCGPASGVAATTGRDVGVSDGTGSDAVVSAIAHDLNNLLTVILGSVEMAVENIPADDPSRELLMTTMAAAERCAELSARLLVWSRNSNAQSD